MPIYDITTSGAVSAEWVEVHHFEDIALSAGAHPEGLHLAHSSSRQVVIVIAGDVLARFGAGLVTLTRGDWLVVPEEGVQLRQARGDEREPAAELVHLSGDWEGLTNVSLFRLAPGDELRRHYHDFHEYWLVYRGKCRAETDDIAADIGPGSLVATGMGYEHAIPQVYDQFEAVAVLTKAMGRRRREHLHSEEDGRPVPFDK